MVKISSEITFAFSFFFFFFFFETHFLLVEYIYKNNIIEMTNDIALYFSSIMKEAEAKKLRKFD